MNTKMSLLDFYITKYEFNVNDKLNKGQGMNIDGSINAEEIFRDKKEDGILVKWKQANNIILTDDSNNQFGNIDIEIVGVFLFDLNLPEEEIEKILLINCNAILYQQVRAIINANTALTNSVPNIIVPVINFNIPYEEGKKEKNKES